MVYKKLVKEAKPASRKDFASPLHPTPLPPASGSDRSQAPESKIYL